MVFAYEHVHACIEQGSEAEVVVGQRFLQHVGVETVQIEDAQLAAERAHVLDDLAGGAFAQDVVEVPAVAGAFHHAHERLDAERVMLRGDGQAAVGGALVRVVLFQHVRLLDDLARVTQQVRALVR